jgi:hypothetical protein
MLEQEFEPKLRRALHEHYWPIGVWENNKTGYHGAHHRQFGGPGAGDLVGRLDGLYIEIETKQIHGRLSAEQLIRRENITRTGCLYVVCQEVGLSMDGEFDDGFTALCRVIDAHHLKQYGLRRHKAMKKLQLKASMKASRT